MLIHHCCKDSCSLKIEVIPHSQTTDSGMGMRLHLASAQHHTAVKPYTGTLVAFAIPTEALVVIFATAEYCDVVGF